MTRLASWLRRFGALGAFLALSLAAGAALTGVAGFLRAAVVAVAVFARARRGAARGAGGVFLAGMTNDALS